MTKKYIKKLQRTAQGGQEKPTGHSGLDTGSAPLRRLRPERTWGRQDGSGLSGVAPWGPGGPGRSAILQEPLPSRSVSSISEDKLTS